VIGERRLVHTPHLRPLLVSAALLLVPILAGGTARAEGASPASEAEPPGPEHGKISTSDASPVGARATEVELSYGPSWNLHGEGDFDRSARGHSHALGLAVTYGLVDDVDVSVEVGYGTAYDAAYDGGAGTAGSAHGQGLTDSAAGIRWRFLTRPGLDLAWKSGLVLPTGAKATSTKVGLTQSFWSFENAVVASKDFGPFTADAELGYSLPFGSKRGDDRGTLFANLAGGWQVLPWLQPELELNYERSYEAGPEREVRCLYVTGGVVAPFGAGYRITAGVQYAAWGQHTGQSINGAVAFKAAF
jgi:hypothetical protein